MRREIISKKAIIFGIIIMFVGVSVLQQIQTTVKADITDGLIGYWNFNEGSGSIVHDTSGFGNDGTINGAPWTIGKSGSALEIKDTSYVGNIPASFDDSITTAITISAWVKWYGPSSYPHMCIIFDGRGEPSLGEGFLFYIDPVSYQLGFWLNQNLPDSDIKSISTIPIGSWTHVAAVFDHSSNVCRWYINGNLDNTHAITNAYIQSPVQPVIGNNHWLDGNWGPINGILDEVRLYNRVLSADEIKQLAGIENQQPTADFTYSPSSPTDMNLIQFTDQSTDSDGTITSWSWGFGDGSASALQNPTHKYADDGTYHVTLTATDNKGASTSTSKDVVVSNVVPTADAGGPYNANVNDLITFDGSGSHDVDGTIAGYRWDFTNDGTYDTGWLTSATTTHSYSSDGIYTVKLQVKDDDDATATDTITATILPVVEPTPSANVNGPYSGYVNAPITFSSAGSTGGSDGTITSWYWTFGDGTFTNLQNPTHSYTSSGTFTVTLKVTNNYGKTDTGTTKATIIPTPLPGTPHADAGGPYSGVVGSSITFDGSGSTDPDGTITSYIWNFGDSNTGTGVSPTHTYSTEGNYTVVLTVTDNDGKTNSSSITASIKPIGRPTIVIFVDVSNIEPIEEENEKTIPVTVTCYNQTVSNIHLEILESSNLTFTILSPDITLNPGESRELFLTIKAPKLKANVTVGSETIRLKAVGDGNVTSNTEQINLKVVKKGATPGFETVATITAVGTAGALVAFFRRRDRNR